MSWRDYRTRVHAPRTVACRAAVNIRRMTALDLTLLYLLAAVVGVVLCRQFKLPPILGYLAVGVVIGPLPASALPKTGKIIATSSSPPFPKPSPP